MSTEAGRSGVTICVGFIWAADFSLLSNQKSEIDLMAIVTL
jgi:hypothetical protein